MDFARGANTYITLQEDDMLGGGPTHVFAQGVVLTKFCSFGFVMSKTWDLTYIVVSDSTVRLYDSAETFQQNPANYVLNIHLTRKFELSQVSSKNYGRYTNGDPFNVNYFYIEESNGIWQNSRVLKIGSPDREVVENLYRGIKRAMY